MKKFASIYSIFVGLSMIAMWTMFYVTGGIPEINTRPVEIGLHIIAETLTALLLIAGGMGLVENTRRGLQVYSISTGMLLYTLIVSPGYYLQKGEIPFVVMFGVLAVIAVTLLCLSLKHSEKFSKEKN